jgi:hypothetical protein
MYLLFLDGRWSAGDTEKGGKDCPLYEELTNIISKLNNEDRMVIHISKR